MAQKSIELSGYYVDRGKIRLASKKLLEWGDLSTEEPPNIPYGTRVEITITHEQSDYLNGENEIVWATHDQHQAEVICGTLRAQDIACEIQEKRLDGTRLHLIRITHPEKVTAAMDFIWRDESGLKLQPDWHYPAGSENESFQRWVNDV
jgi:hypothetical protein